jgi:hypothetical protein
MMAKKKKFKKTVSLHRVGKEVVEVKRQWGEDHLAAGYHKQEFGEHATRDHRLLGVHKTPLRGKILVEHTDGPPKFDIRDDGKKELVHGSWTHGPEFKLTYEDGSAVQVICADTVKEYLKLAGKKVR